MQSDLDAKQNLRGGRRVEHSALPPLLLLSRIHCYLDLSSALEMIVYMSVSAVDFKEGIELGKRHLREVYECN